ncbi:hypothetical protein [Streptomyces sp. RerS4]|uniref:hypothetical protein n=1 Tax=Streptomyces sp. RerS4 TaxID=2942449 RepID=UPI00201C3E73|nr:hypothetical protein [Streptomyces sp. RerS4]UQX04874.1 hypothetical protein M4D82_06235 [Streptomyces sp. RerS4]
MARRPFPRIIGSGSASLTRGRELARTAADSATDVLHPLLVIGRGLRVLAALGRRKWAETPKDKRGPAFFLGVACVLAVGLVPYGPLAALISLMAAAAWQGRDRTPVKSGPGDAETERLGALYEALVPYFSIPEDPNPLFAHGGDWEQAFSDYAFDEAGRVTRLRIRYPAYFTDGEAASRARIEALLHAKSGRGREYLFEWDEEGNQLDLSVLAALPTGVAAQRFVTSPGETVLGFTDPGAVQRTLPVVEGEESRDMPPVIWRTGPRSAEPHLLVVGQPGSGTSTLLRSVALQALGQGGDVLIVEGGASGEYACLTGRVGVLAVECGPTGAEATLEWAARETERRLIATHRAREAGRPAPEDARRPLWILLDRPSVLAHLAASEGRPDPLARLQVPLRHGRAASLTVVVAEQFDHLELLHEAVWQHTRARVVLGPATGRQITDVLGLPPHTTPPAQLPPGRGYARLGTGAVHRLQVPATPDPYDDATPPAQRQAVLELLPQRQAPAPDDGEGHPTPSRPLQVFRARHGSGEAEAMQATSIDASEIPEVPAEAP